MDMSPSPTTTFCLPDELNIALASEYHQRMLAVLKESDDIVIDAGNVTRIDTAALQFIYVCQQVMAERGGAIRWLAVSEAFAESAGILGLTESLVLSKATESSLTRTESREE